MNTERTEKFVNAIACDLEEGGFRQVSGTTLRRTLATAVSAALPLLEAGNPVSELAEQQGVALPPLPRMQEFTSLYGRVSAFGPDQMRDYARAAFAAGATAASTGAVLVNMGDSEAEFIRMGNDESALAATGKQQVGEVKGRFDISAVMDRCIRELRSFIDVAHDYDLDEMAVQALETAIESMELRKQPAQGIDLGRQPTPMGWSDTDFLALGNPIPLRIFRKAVMRFKVMAELGVDVESMPMHFMKSPEKYAADVFEANRLLALIDGQRDAAPGVGNG